MCDHALGIGQFDYFEKVIRVSDPDQMLIYGLERFSFCPLCGIDVTEIAEVKFEAIRLYHAEISRQVEADQARLRQPAPGTV